MHFKAGDSVVVNKDLLRAEGPYAQKGETGTVLELFYSGTGCGEKIPYVKVAMTQGGIKTFRVQSVSKVGSESKYSRR